MANYTIIGGDNKEYGPVSEADIRQWIAEGRLNADSRAKAESDAEFRELAQFPEFATALKSQSTPGTIAPLTGTPGVEDPNWEANVLARDPELKFGECLAAGWSFLGANADFVIPAVLLTWVIYSVLVVISVTVPIIGPFVLLCFQGVVMGGFYLACLRRLRGEAVSPVEVFSGFKVAFPQLLLTGLVSALLAEISFCFLILPAIYLAVAWFFAVPLVADKKMFFWAGMELSRKVVTRVWFEVFVLIIVMFLPMIIFQVFSFIHTGKYFMGLWDQSGHNWQQLAQTMQTQGTELRNLTLKSTLIGQGVFLLNLFYAAGVIVRAYENLFGTRKP
jgi:hypothetical protein